MVGAKLQLLSRRTKDWSDKQDKITLPSKNTWKYRWYHGEYAHFHRAGCVRRDKLVQRIDREWYDSHSLRILSQKSVSPFPNHVIVTGIQKKLIKDKTTINPSHRFKSTTTITRKNLLIKVKIVVPLRQRKGSSHAWRYENSLQHAPRRAHQKPAEVKDNKIKEC